MPRCEDYPCCGHTDGEGCPDRRPGFYPYPCVQCGDRIRHNEAAPGHESFHLRCLDAASSRWERDDDYRDYPSDY